MYNCDDDDIRTVTITPSKSWGGSGRYVLHIFVPFLPLNSNVSYFGLAWDVT